LLLVAAIGTSSQEADVQDRQKIKDELFAAARKGDFTTAKDLLSKYPEMTNAKDSGGWTLLHMVYNNRELIEYLIKNGADINARSDGLWTLLHSQAYGGYLDGVELLLQHGADIEAKSQIRISFLRLRQIPRS
jgi:ankyrin repeat protein